MRRSKTLSSIQEQPMTQQDRLMHSQPPERIDQPKVEPHCLRSAMPETPAEQPVAETSRKPSKPPDQNKNIKTLQTQLRLAGAGERH